MIKGKNKIWPTGLAIIYSNWSHRAMLL